MARSNASFSVRTHRMDAALLQPFIEAFVATLKAGQYTPLTIAGYEDSARHFSDWLWRNKIEFSQVGEDVVQHFACHRCRCPGARRQSRVSPKYVRRVGRFIRFLVDRGALAAPPSTPKNIDPQVAVYQDWLRHHRAISERTIDRHGRMIMRLLSGLGSDPEVYDAALIRRIILAEARSSPPHVKTMTTALRGYLPVPGSGRPMSFWPRPCGANHPAVAPFGTASLPASRRRRTGHLFLRSQQAPWSS